MPEAVVGSYVNSMFRCLCVFVCVQAPVYVHRCGGQRSAAGVLQAPSHPPCFSEGGSLTDLVLPGR